MTKTIAKAAQKFPQSGGLVRVSQRGVLALMLGTVALPVSGAWAEVLLGQLYTNTITRTSVSPLVVTTTSDFSVNTTAGRGIDLYSQGGISFTDANQSAITGFTAGINAQNIDAAGPGGGGGRGRGRARCRIGSAARGAGRGAPARGACRARGAAK